MSTQQFTVGSSSECTYTVSHPSVCEKHLFGVPLSESEYLLRDVSDGGEMIVDRKTVVMARVNKYNRIQIGKKTFSLDDLFKGKLLEGHQTSDTQAFKTEYNIDNKKTYVVGASTSCHITLPSPRVAWKSFKMTGKDGNWEIHPFHGDKKPFVWENGKTLKVGSYQLELKGDMLKVLPVTDNCIDLSNIEVVVKDRKTKEDLRLAQNVSLSVQSGEFVGIIGPSGAGKSVLLKAIRGLVPIRNGQIFLNAQAAGKDSPLFQEIGFIPQDDVVYPELTVEENLRFAATLRLPSDWPPEAIDNEVSKLLQRLYLTDCRDTSVSEISGGQRKRVNLATEMILEPSFIMADEVCSGLSSWDTDNIIHHLRRIADDGKIVMLTIHTPDIESLDLMDMLLVYDKGGLIAYYGPAQPDAMQYFSNQQLSPYRSPKLIFDVLERREKKEGKEERKTSPEEWNAKYRNSPYYYRYVEGRRGESCTLETSVDSDEKTLSHPEGSEKSAKAQDVFWDECVPKSFLKQILYLTFRRLLAFYRDKTDVKVTFGQAPLMALAFFFVFQEIIQPGATELNLFQHLRKYTAGPDIIIFLAVLAAVWFGSSKAIAEIPKAQVFYHQERLSFLNNTAFIISRFFALSVITLGQILLFAVTFHIVFVTVPNFLFSSGSGGRLMHVLLMKFSFLLWLVSVASVATAMCISFFIKSPSAANAILPFLLILQILLGGSRIQPIAIMNKGAYFASHFMVSRWGFEASALLFESNLNTPGKGEFINSDMKPGAATALKKVEKLTFEQLQKTQNEGIKDIVREVVEYIAENDIVDENEKSYISKLKQNIEGISIPPTSKLSKEIVNQFNDVFLGNRARAVAELKKISEKHDIQLWEWLLDVYPRLKLFRPAHTVTTWMMLSVITILSIMILGVCFRLRYGK